MIEIAILKNFDSGTYKAGVQLAGSLTTYFDDISVARNIPSSALVIGNYVIVAIPGGNPRDACVIAAWPQGSPGGGTFLDLSDTPSSYSGQKGLLVSVADSENALEFIAFLLAQAFSLGAWSYKVWTDTNGFIPGHSGSGSDPAASFFNLRFQTGATSGSASYLYGNQTYYQSSHPAHNTILSVGHSRVYPVNSTFWLGFFASTTSNPSDTENQVAFKVVNNRIYARCANGTNDTEVDTGIDNSAGVIFKLAIVKQGSEAKFYVDGALKATITTNLPSSVFLYWVARLRNDAASNQIYDIYPMMLDRASTI